LDNPSVILAKARISLGFLKRRRFQLSLEWREGVQAQTLCFFTSLREIQAAGPSGPGQAKILCPAAGRAFASFA